MAATDMILQVLICTFGKDGIEHIAKGEYPHVKGVEYLVSWQLPDGDQPVPDELKNRPDFKIIKSGTKGLSKNRNIALQAASAPICLIADDDVEYTADQLKRIIDYFSKYPNADIITFEYESIGDAKSYPSKSFNLDTPPKGYYVTSFEITFRRDKVIESGVLFNERFGIGAEFMAGEEEIFIHDLLSKGLSGIFIPEVIAMHNHPTTATRHADNPDFIRTKGAMFVHLHPRTGFLRMIIHAVRNTSSISFFQYLRSWLSGAYSELSMKSPQK